MQNEPDKVDALLARLERALLALAGDRPLDVELAPHDEQHLDRFARHVTRGWTRVVFGRGRLRVEVHRPLELRGGSLVIPPFESHELRAAPRSVQIEVLRYAAELAAAALLRVEHDDAPDRDEVLASAARTLDTIEAE